MDMVDYDQSVFDKIVGDYQALLGKLNLHHVKYIPVSALKGDNVSSPSINMLWYKDQSLLDYLEIVETYVDEDTNYTRMPVQWVVRPQTDALHDYRGYAGKVLSGTFKLNDSVTVLPSGFTTTLDRIELFDKRPDEAVAGMSVTLHLKDEIDISRGDILVKSNQPPIVSQMIEADLCWMDTKPLDPTVTYLVQHNSKVTRARISEVLYKMQINTLEKLYDEEFKLNDIGRIVIKTADPLAFDVYQKNKANGRAIIIDSRTNLTVGALMFRAAAE
jgi:sulfate adenylyltransferase subunit 1